MNTNEFVIEQDYSRYTEEDHKVWSILYDRQTNLILKQASSEFLRGFRLLSLGETHIPRIEEMNEKLYDVSGWSVVPVTGLIPSKEFLHMLQVKQFPITVKIRKMEELDFSELPDMFHDIFGHVPMLMNPLFSDFLMEYGKIALKNLDNEKAILALTRFYWFTLEMGVIREKGMIKPYGGAILTSVKEIETVRGVDVPKKEFDVLDIFNTPYDNLKLQQQYFVLSSFEQLFDSLTELEPALVKVTEEEQPAL